MCRHSLTFYGSCDIPACNLTFYDVNLLSNINFPGEFEDGRSLFALIRPGDDLEALLGRSVHVLSIIIRAHIRHSLRHIMVYLRRGEPNVFGRQDTSTS